MRAIPAFPVGRIAGIPIRVSWLLPAAMAYCLVSTRHYARAAVLVTLAVYFGVLLVSTLLHEFGHALVGRHHRLRDQEITLTVFGGFTRQDKPRSPRAALHVALAGVAVNFALALVAGMALRLRDGEWPGLPHLDWSEDWLLLTWNLNLALGIFNLLPGIPFDGGRALEAFLWTWGSDRARARHAVLFSGAILGAGLLVGGVSKDQPFLVILGFWAVYSVIQEWQEFRQEGLEDERFLGVYDFSEGYRSVEASAPPPDRAERKAAKAAEAARREEERKAAVAVRERETADQRLDRLLDRIAAEGLGSLSPEERAFLDEESRRRRAKRR